MEKLKPQLKGYITITNPKTGKVLFAGENTIAGDALEITARSLSNLNGAPSIDLITAIGQGFSAAKFISTATYDSQDNSMNFQALFMEADFDGTVTETKLSSSLLGLDFATKIGLSIIKGNTSMLSIAWKIIMT